ncbi:MAG: class I SAM-dependent methyltransferase, partial [Chloroflexota bacterium]|nr:class I SAM-dependent methyltransferase [Chloroflexota bacterium]
MTRSTHADARYSYSTDPWRSADLVVSSWVIEAVPDPLQAMSEYLRVINEGGYVLYTFCSLPAGWVSRAGTALLRATVEHQFGGTFLPPERTPWHDCNRSYRLRSPAGLTRHDPPSNIEQAGDAAGLVKT